MKKILFTILLAITMILIGCKTFVPKESKAQLKSLEKHVYIMKKGVTHGKHSLKKGQSVKIIVMPGDNWIKVYAYPSYKDKLNAPRVLVVFSFDEDYKLNIYNYKIFKADFDKVLMKKQ